MKKSTTNQSANHPTWIQVKTSEVSKVAFEAHHRLWWIRPAPPFLGPRLSRGVLWLLESWNLPPKKCQTTKQVTSYCTPPLKRRCSQLKRCNSQKVSQKETIVFHPSIFIIFRCDWLVLGRVNAVEFCQWISSYFFWCISRAEVSWPH